MTTVSDQERFAALYERHYGDVLRYAWRRVGAERAEDVVAETFAVMWRRKAEVPAANELPWLYAVARKVVANMRRRDARERQLIDSARIRREPDHAEQISEHAAALVAFSQLNERDRELVRLIAWEGLEAHQAAEVLGCSRTAVYVRLHRVRKRLERLLDTPHQQERIR